MTFADALLRRNVRFRVSGGGKTHLNCPFCTERGKPTDTKMRLCVHSVQGWARCLHCDWKHRYGAVTVLRRLGIDADIDGVARPEPEKAIEPVELPEDFQLLSKASDELDLQARGYLLGRGVTPKQIRENRIGVSYSGRYAYRVIFPVYVNGELRGLNARDFTGRRKPKYLNSVGDKWMFHFDPAARTVVLSEGVVKALRIERATGLSSASILGHDLTARQLEQVQSGACERVILYPDVDKVGRVGFCKVADAILESTGVRVDVVWPVPGPADDVPLKELHALVERFVVPYSWHLRLKMLL